MITFKKLLLQNYWWNDASSAFLLSQIGVLYDDDSE